MFEDYFPSAKGRWDPQQRTKKPKRKKKKKKVIRASPPTPHIWASTNVCYCIQTRLQVCSANPTHNNPFGDYALSWGFFK